MNDQRIGWVNQGRNGITINATPEHIWSILENTQRLREWMPVVKHSDGRHEALDAVRTCQVFVEGKDGIVVERCVVFDSPRRIGWEIIEDSVGFSKMLKNFSFDFVLEPLGPNSTRLINSSYFEPRTWIAWLFVKFMIRKDFHALRLSVLANLKRLSEEKSSQF